jgi:hypothetical protein
MIVSAGLLKWIQHYSAALPGLESKFFSMCADSLETLMVAVRALRGARFLLQLGTGPN